MVTEHVHRASPSHDEGAWCSMGDSPCGKFLPVAHFTDGDTKRYYTDGRGVPNLFCWACQAVVTLPHEHVAFYRTPDSKEAGKDAE